MKIDSKVNNPRSLLYMLFLGVIALALSSLILTSYASTPTIGGSSFNSSIIIVESEGIVPVDIHTEP